MSLFGRKEPSVETFQTAVAGLISERFMNSVQVCQQRLDNTGDGYGLTTPKVNEYANTYTHCLSDYGSTITSSYETALSRFGIRIPSRKLADSIRQHSRDSLQTLIANHRKQVEQFAKQFNEPWPSHITNASITTVENGVKGRIETLIHSGPDYGQAPTKSSGEASFLRKHQAVIITVLLTALVTSGGWLFREMYWRDRVADKDRRVLAQQELVKELVPLIDSTVSLKDREWPDLDSARVQEKREWEQHLKPRLETKSTRNRLANAFDQKVMVLFDSVVASAEVAYDDERNNLTRDNWRKREVQKGSFRWWPEWKESNQRLSLFADSLQSVLINGVGK